MATVLVNNYDEPGWNGLPIFEKAPPPPPPYRKRPTSAQHPCPLQGGRFLGTPGAIERNCPKNVWKCRQWGVIIKADNLEVLKIWDTKTYPSNGGSVYIFIYIIGLY
jgi:hypothetical protein